MGLYDKLNPNEPDKTSGEQFKEPNEQENIAREEQKDALERRDSALTKEDAEGKKNIEQKEFDNTSPSLENEIANEGGQTQAQPSEEKDFDSTTPSLENEKSNEDGMEHTWETQLENGGIFDQLTEQIGQGIVDKLSSKEQAHDKNETSENKDQEDHDKWNALANEFSPESAIEDNTPDKDMDMDER